MRSQLHDDLGLHTASMDGTLVLQWRTTGATRYETETRGERVTYTVEFFQQDLPMPKISSTDMETKAAADLTHARQNPTPASPFYKFGDEALRALDLLGEIFSKSHSIKEEIANQKSTKSHKETISASRVENHRPT